MSDHTKNAVRFARPPQMADHLRSKFGMRISPSTLAKFRLTGDGPPFRKCGRDIIYEIAAAEEWAEARLAASYRSTSELPSAEPKAA